MWLKQWAKEKKWHISEEKTEKKAKNYYQMISVNGKGTVFPVKLKLEGELFE